MDLLNQDLGELQKQSDEMKKQKQMIQLAGILGDAVGSAPSFGEAYLGRNNPKSNFSGAANAFAAGMEDPLERQKNLLGQYRAQKQAKTEIEQEDPTSERNKRFRDSLKQQFAAMGLGKMAGTINDGLTENSYQKNFESLYKPVIAGEYDIKKEVAKANIKPPKGYTRQVNPQTGEAELVLDNPNKNAFDHLPMEDQEQVKVLGQKNAQKSSIKNQLDALVTTLTDKKLTDAQKLPLAMSGLKVINSQEGQDALGSEESHRLGSLLEFHFLNLTKPGPVIGRAPIGDFTNQVAVSSQQLGEAVGRNNKQIQSLYAGHSNQGSPDTRRNLVYKKDKTGNGLINNAHANEDDPQISKYANDHGLSYSSAENILRGRGYGQ